MEEQTPGENVTLQLLEALLETQMRNYDVNMAILTAITGNRNAMDALRAQHAQGLYYFPPFALADTTVDTDDDQRDD